MTAKGKLTSSSAKTVNPVIVFGLDANSKPKAGRFLEKQAAVARKAAGQLKLRVLPISTPKLAEVAARVPVGRIHANGRGLVGPIRPELYAKLMAAAARQPTPAAPAGCSGPGHGGSGQGSSNGNDTVKAAKLPRDWDEIAPGHLVIVQETPEDGWYEALVLERSGDMLGVRWRDYSRDRKFMRHRLSVALAHPEPQVATAKANAPATAGAAKPASAKPSSRSSAQGEQLLPENWDEIDVGHLVLAKQDGPWGGWWEAIPMENHGHHLTLRWRDYPQLPVFTRPRLSLALLHPKP
jgi:hypothetical protein